MQRVVLAALATVLSMAITGCSASTSDITSPEAPSEQETETEVEAPSEPESKPEAETQQPSANHEDVNSDTSDMEADTMRMSIDGTDVTVEWEDNQAVADLQALVNDAPLTVNLSMYGGFEQVGPLGTYLTSSDVQTTTTAGDIVLYAGNQIVVFYGSNSWAYTRLGHITSQSAEGMTELLSHGDVSITIASGRE